VLHLIVLSCELLTGTNGVGGQSEFVLMLPASGAGIPSENE
jgi:hypothetical protein